VERVSDEMNALQLIRMLLVSVRWPEPADCNTESLDGKCAEGRHFSDDICRRLIEIEVLTVG